MSYYQPSIVSVVDPWQIAFITFCVVAGLVLLISTLVLQFYGRIWLRAYMSNATVGFPQLIAMSLRQVKVSVIVDAKIVLIQAGITGISTTALEAHYLAGGNVERVVHAMVIANRAGMPLDFSRAAAIDLAGRDVLAAVSMTVSPRVIDCPPTKTSGRAALSAIARDGVELRIQARVTVRTNLDTLIGGATEETILARVGQGIISTVGSANSHSDVLCQPELISERLIRQGLDSNTTYEIVSIDISRIDVGINIGARIRTEYAEAEMRVSQALAESRRAEALALHQEFRALVQEKKAELVRAEALLPAAIGTAARSGNIGKFDNETMEIGFYGPELGFVHGG